MPQAQAFDLITNGFVFDILTYVASYLISHYISAVT